MAARHRQRGFTYLGVLFLVAAMGAVLASAGTIWHTARQHEKERELLYIGAQFRKAIRQYREQSPGEVKQYPGTLDNLLEDRRHAVVRRHLRKVFVDPMTGKAEWGLLQADQGGIWGVHSLSDAPAQKTANFSEQDRDFEGKALVSEWRFIHGGPPAAPAPSDAASAPATPGR